MKPRNQSQAEGQSAIAAGLILLSTARADVIAVPRLSTGARTASSAIKVWQLPVLTYPSSKAPHYELAFDDAPAAMEAVRHWRYQPMTLNDQPVEVVTQIQVIFRLN